MSTTPFENLDIECAKVGKEIAKKPSKELEKVITDALSVLEEQGVYALFLFLKTHNKKTEGTEISNKLKAFLQEKPKQSPLIDKNDKIWQPLQTMAEDLDKLLFARDLIRQTLIYARYHARLIDEEKEVQK
ncbi:MAG: hypothetical protein L3V56_06595 [Candidatus Magnetoovum sp. WYHC-5]|nr:hypothetical protein [Candidatus Magnetoovum sp. WYHC-5]